MSSPYPHTLHYRMGRLLAAVLDRIDADGTMPNDEPHPLIQDAAPLYQAIAAGRMAKRVNSSQETSA